MVDNSDIVSKKSKLLESQRIKLISPILHIGAEVQKLNPFEYVKTADKIYIPNQEALGKALYQQGGSFLNDYITAIEQEEDISRLLENAFGKEWWNTKASNGERIFPETGISDNWSDSNNVSKIRPMIRNGMGHKYIPGSSIKGAIRTAIAYHMLKEQPTRVSEIEIELRKRLGERTKPSDSFFMKDLFSNFSLRYDNNPIGSVSDANTDFMRAIKITDSKPLIQKIIKTKKGTVKINKPVVAEVVISSFANTRTKEGFINKVAKYKAPLYVEMVSEVRTEFTLSLDTRMLAWFEHQQGIEIPFKTITDILRICNQFSQAQWIYERKYWSNITNNYNDNLDFDEIKDEYEKPVCPYDLRIGWGNGMTGTTISLCYEQDKTLIADIRDASASASAFKAPGYEAPKSRRTVSNADGEIKFVPGWVKFK